MITPYVLRVIGRRAARRYFQTAEVFDAREARQIALLHQVAEPEQLDQQIGRVPKQLKSAAPRARAIAKEVANDIAGRAIDDVLLSEIATLVADIRARPEAGEGLSAFLEKRKPSWS